MTDKVIAGVRKNFEMTELDLAKLLNAMKTAPAIALHCGISPSPQEQANAAWAELGERMGFDGMTAMPNGLGDRCFSAITVPRKKPHVFRDGNKWCATWPHFINLQESPAGFGDTPEMAISELQGA